MADTPRIILHNSDTSALVQELIAAFPRADYRTCNSYEGLPDLIHSYRPDIVYSVRFAGSEDYPRAALVAAPTGRAGSPMAGREPIIAGAGIRIGQP